ncbi:MAG: GGDEF domain-containing protein [Synechococcus lacustris]
MKQFKLKLSTQLIITLAIAAAAYGINLLNLPLFFGVNVLLGQSLAILLTLQWRGPWGLIAGTLAGFATWSLWGHPWAVIIFALEQLAIYYWVNLRRSTSHSREDGSVILVDMIYWLLIGMPLVWIFYSGILHMDSANVGVVAIKQAINGVINSAIGFLLYLSLRLLLLKLNGKKYQGTTTHGISVRSMIFALVFTCISLPTLANTVFSAHQVSESTQGGIVATLSLITNSIERNLSNQGNGVATGTGTTNTQESPSSPTPHQAFAQKINYQITKTDGSKFSSSPALFESLGNNYKASDKQFITVPNLNILITKKKVPLLKKWINGYWTLESKWPNQANSPYKSIQVVMPARETVIRMQHLSTEILYSLAAVIGIGVVIAELLSRSFQAQFSLLIAPFLSESEAISKQPVGLPLLRMSAITEFSELASLVNERILRTNNLTRELQASNEELANSRDQLALLSTTDDLTGCLNRRKLDEILEQELARGSRTGEPLCCVTFDIDYFKQINDTHGHLGGDKVLRAVAQQAKQRLRSTDYLCRFGGDEFVVILPACPLNDALNVMEALRQSIDNTIHDINGSNCKVSLSVGVTLADYKLDNGTSLLKRSDDALFKAKQNGRNRIIHQSIAG